MKSAGPPGVPATVGDLDAAWITAALGPETDVSDVGEPRRIGQEFGLASEVWRVPVGAPLGAVVVKLWDTTTTAGTGEVAFYRRFGDDPGIRVPRCHHAAVDEEAGRGVLVLEDLSSARQGDATATMGPGDRERVVRGIARFHARWWGPAAPEGLPPRIHLPGMGEVPDFIEDRRRGYERRFGPLGDSPLDRVIRNAEVVLARSEQIVAGAPPTLLHGDLHLDNVLFVGEAEEPCFLDWTRTGVGPGVRSLANIAFNMSPAGTTEEVVGSYLDELERCGVEYDAGIAQRHLAAATVRAVLVWTLGMVRWVPAGPREEAMIDLTLRGAAHAADLWDREMPGWPYLG